MTGSDPERPARRAATQVVQSGRDPFAHHGFVNTPIYRGSTVLFPTVASLKARSAQFTYGRRGTPTSEALEEAIAKLEGGARTWLAPSGSAAIAAILLSFVKTGDHILVIDTVYQPTRKFCDGMLQALRRRDHLLRSAGRRRHRRTDPAQHAARLHREPGLADLRGAGHPRHRARRTPSGAVACDGQHLGEPALLQAVRARRRRLDPGGDQIHRRPCRCDARRDHGERGARGPAMLRQAQELGICAGLGGDLSRHARAAHPRRAAGAAPALRRCRSRSGSRAARGCARPASRAAEPSPARVVEARLPRRQRPVLHRAQAGAAESRGGRDARRAWSCSAWAARGAATKA